MKLRGDVIVIQVLIVGATALLGQTRDWTATTQKPFQSQRPESRRLPPLLESSAPIMTAADWNKARASIHSRWVEFLGAPPAKPTSLDVKTEASEKQQGWTRSRISFEAEGSDRIEGYLLTPDLTPNITRRPAVVVFHETTPNTCRQPAGVAGPPDRAFGVDLVRRGYVVLCPECYILKPIPDAKQGGPINWAKLRAAELKRRRPDWTGMGKLVYDASRCVDFLQSLPEVDRSRIGCLGFSLGAKQVIYAMAFEPRYIAGVANEGGVGIDMSNWADEWYLGAAIRQRTRAMDHHQLLALAAPRALLIQGGGSADGPQSWPFVESAMPIYSLLGAKERIGLFDHRGGHTFPPEARRIAYEWLDDWLGQKPANRDLK